MNDLPSCVGLRDQKKYLPLNFTFTGIPVMVILNLSANLVFNCFYTKKSTGIYIFALKFLWSIIQ